MLLKDSAGKVALPGAPYFLVVCSATKKLNTGKFKKLIKCKNLRFAQNDEVYEVTGCITGAVPPFGSLFTKPVMTYVDASLAAQPTINFNCGLRTHSMQLTFNDYKAVEDV